MMRSDRITRCRSRLATYQSHQWCRCPCRLSLGAVEKLSIGTAIDPRALHEATAGNPFFVTEVIAAGGAHVPSTVREAVWARTKRLSATGSQIVRAASVLGRRCDVEVLSDVTAANPEDIDNCIAGGMLRRQHSTIEFSHELARLAVLDSLAASELSRLHQLALTALTERSPSAAAAELARHAVGACDADAVLVLSPRAAAEAALLGAHKASLAHYDNALKYAGRLAPAAKAPLLAAHAHECWLTDKATRAVASQEEAIANYREAGDPAEEGRAISDLAEYLWWNGESDRAYRAASRAVAIFESTQPDANVARAYARVAQISMMCGLFDIASEWAMEAIAMGERFGAEAVVVHALNTHGVSQICLGIDDGWPGSMRVCAEPPPAISRKTLREHSTT